MPRKKNSATGASKEADDILCMSVEDGLIKGVVVLATDVEKMVEERVADLEGRSKKNHKRCIHDYMHGTFLKDFAFGNRLFKLNFPKDYIVVFRDEDNALSDSQLWEKVQQNFKQVTNARKS